MGLGVQCSCGRRVTYGRPLAYGAGSSIWGIFGIWAGFDIWAALVVNDYVQGERNCQSQGFFGYGRPFQRPIAYGRNKTPQRVVRLGLEEIRLYGALTHHPGRCPLRR
jgi:hypothetical protein